jgi:hypothetical protein
MQTEVQKSAEPMNGTQVATDSSIRRRKHSVQLPLGQFFKEDGKMLSASTSSQH